MKVAARFPVTSYPLYWVLLIVYHLIILVLGLWFIGFQHVDFLQSGFLQSSFQYADFQFFDWQWSLVFLVFLLSISAYFSFSYYKKLTTAKDDLCWSGALWLMNFEPKLIAPHYLKLQPDSWISQRISLLHFKDEKHDYYWLFARASLGINLYSQLVRLAKSDIDQSLKIDH